MAKKFFFLNLYKYDQSPSKKEVVTFIANKKCLGSFLWT